LYPTWAEEVDMPQDEQQQNGNGSASETIASALKNNKELLASAALSAAGAFAASKGPDLVRRLTEATENRGEETAQKLGSKALEGAKERLSGSGIAGKALWKAMPGGGDEGDGEGQSGRKKTRRLPIQRWTDVAVPLEKAYAEWTNFDQYPQFMHRVLNVEEEGDDTVRWQEKIWFSTREWEGRITDRRKNDRIVWKTTSGMSHRGIVSFHKLGENLTRVMVDVEFEPNGMIEKMASGLRFVKRAVQADLARFKAYVEMNDAEGIEYRSADEDEKPGRPQRQGGDPHESDGRRAERQQRREERRRTAA
jgi:uncharacterized membrane protein